MLKVFKYKLQPNRKQSLALQHTLDVCRDVFNLSLEQWRKEFYPSKSMMRDGVNSSRHSNTRLKALVGELWK